MSGGVVIYIPNLDRNMIPFAPFDNNEFPHNLQLRIEQAKKVNQRLPPTALETITKDPNFHIINAVVLGFIKYLKDDHDTENAPTKALLFAGDIMHIIKNAKMCDHTDYKNNLIRLQREIKKHRIGCMEAGMDQIISRLLYLMKFEDPIQTWDYFALWVEDYGTMDVGPNPQEIIEVE